MLDDIRGYIMMFLYSLNFNRFISAFISLFMIIGVSIASASIFNEYRLANQPALAIISPNTNETTRSIIIVRGKITPSSSIIKVNGKPAILSGDGNFSQVVNLSYGNNVITFEAFFHGKTSRVSYSTKRILTPQEQALHMEALLKEEQKVLGAQTSVATNIMDEKSKESQSTYNIRYRIPEEGILLTHQKETKGLQKIIAGNIKNTTDHDIRNISIKAEFRDSQGDIVDTKIGAAEIGSKELTSGNQTTYSLINSSLNYSSITILISYQ